MWLNCAGYNESIFIMHSGHAVDSNHNVMIVVTISLLIFIVITMVMALIFVISCRRKWFHTGLSISYAINIARSANLPKGLYI